MLNTDEILDDEVLMRRVPPGETWQKAPGPMPTSVNVRLRSGESGISVSRASMTSARRLLELGGGSVEEGWLVMAAKAGDLRKFGLRVVPKPNEEDPGHAEIEPAAHDLSNKHTCRAVIKLFKLVELEDSPEDKAE